MGTKDRDVEWESRVLCSDESCIGVIGSDGRCKECGLAYKGELPAAIDSNSPPPKTDEASAQNEADDPNASLSVDADATDADDEWARRTLCRDESCIGVIGPDGRCKECGKSY